MTDLTMNLKFDRIEISPQAPGRNLTVDFMLGEVVIARSEVHGCLVDGDQVVVRGLTGELLVTVGSPA